VYSLLTLTLFNNHIETARSLIALGAPVLQLNHKRQSALHLASLACNLEFIRCLCIAGASVSDIDANFQTPLNLALKVAHKYPEDPDDTEELSEERAVNYSRANNRHHYHRRNDNTKLERQRDPVPPHQLDVIRSLVVEFDSPVLYTKQHMPSAALQQQYSIHFGAGSQREQIRSRITQPLFQALQLRSLSTLTLLLEAGPAEHVNWIDSSYQTPLDIVTRAIESLEGLSIQFTHTLSLCGCGMILNQDNFISTIHTDACFSMYRQQGQQWPLQRTTNPNLARSLQIAIVQDRPHQETSAAKRAQGCN
jgi:hypothetical protein